MGVDITQCVPCVYCVLSVCAAVMFVDVGENRDVLENLSLSFVRHN